MTAASVASKPQRDERKTDNLSRAHGGAQGIAGEQWVKFPRKDCHQVQELAKQEIALWGFPREN